MQKNFLTNLNNDIYKKRRFHIVATFKGFMSYKRDQMPYPHVLLVFSNVKLGNKRIDGDVLANYTVKFAKLNELYHGDIISLQACLNKFINDYVDYQYVDPKYPTKYIQPMFYRPIDIKRVKPKHPRRFPMPMKKSVQWGWFIIQCLDAKKAEKTPNSDYFKRLYKGWKEHQNSNHKNKFDVSGWTYSYSKKRRAQYFQSLEYPHVKQFLLDPKSNYKQNYLSYYYSKGNSVLNYWGFRDIARALDTCLRSKNQSDEIEKLCTNKHEFFCLCALAMSFNYFTHHVRQGTFNSILDKINDWNLLNNDELKMCYLQMEKGKHGDQRFFMDIHSFGYVFMVLERAVVRCVDKPKASLATKMKAYLSNHQKKATNNDNPNSHK